MEKFIKFLEDNNAWENFERNFIEQGGGGLQLMYRPYFKERIADFDINTLEDQGLFKKLCWQIVEELWSLKYQVNMFHIKSKY